jgi:hypothetical protein
MNDKAVKDIRGVDRRTDRATRPAGPLLGEPQDIARQRVTLAAGADSKSSSVSVKVRAWAPTRLNLEKGVEP